MTQRADGLGVDIIVFPELGLSSYAIDDLLMQDALLDAVVDGLQAIKSATAELHPLLFVGAPLRHCGRLFNCALALDCGILGVVSKTYLPNYRDYYEKRWFASGGEIRQKCHHYRLRGEAVRR